MLEHWGAMKGGLKIGIAGLGGLGLMGVKLAIAMGNEVKLISNTRSILMNIKKVTVISSSPNKEKAAK